MAAAGCLYEVEVDAAHDAVLVYVRIPVHTNGIGRRGYSGKRNGNARGQRVWVDKYVQQDLCEVSAVALHEHWSGRHIVGSFEEQASGGGVGGNHRPTS